MNFLYFLCDLPVSGRFVVFGVLISFFAKVGMDEAEHIQVPGAACYNTSRSPARWTIELRCCLKTSALSVN